MVIILSQNPLPSLITIYITKIVGKGKKEKTRCYIAFLYFHYSDSKLIFSSQINLELIWCLKVVDS